MIQYFIGIDLGTSAVKLLLVDEQGRIEREVTKEYPLSFPHPGWSEQNPEDWWKAVQHGVLQLTEHIDKSAVRGIGVGGQMHGLVALDEDDAVIRPAILWNDGRTGEEVAYLNETIGKEKLSALTANIAFAGFTAPKLLWMRRNEPENFARIRKIMLPKDYINYRLTGVHSCDYSDASGMLLLDVEHKCWSKEMLEICGVDESWMPKLFESYEPIGTIRGFVSGALGLPRDCVVVAGAGDNAAAAVGTGVVGEGGCNISLGTSGTLFISSKQFAVDPNNALHAFAHADGGWHLMGCMLSAASCNKWLCEEILHTTDYAAEQAGEQPRVLPAVPDGRTQPDQRHERPRHLYGHHDGHDARRPCAGRARGRGLRHPRQLRGGQIARHRDPAQLPVRRRGQVAAVAQDLLERPRHPA